MAKGSAGKKAHIGDGQPIEAMIPPTFKKMKKKDSDNLMKKMVDEGNKTGHRIWTDPMVAIRRQALVDLYAQGYSRREIIVEIMDKWGCSENQGYKWMKDALEWLQEGNEEFRDYNRDKQVEKLEKIAKDAKNAGEYKAAVAAIAEMNKLLGLGEQKVKVDIERVFKFDGDA